MIKSISTLVILLVAATAAVMPACPRPAAAAEATVIDREVQAALTALYDKTPAARMLGEKAKAIMVFPDIIKAGFLVGVQYGEGALLVNGETEGYYNIASASYGLQAGVQKFGYAMFLLTDSALNYLRKSGGWEAGVGPSVVVVNAGMAKTLTTTTVKKDVYAFIFSQKGLMAGVGLQGTKITRIKR